MDRVILIIRRLGYRSFLYLDLIGSGNWSHHVSVKRLIYPLGRYVPWDVLSLLDVLSLGTFCPLGCYVLRTLCPWDILSQDVLSWGVLYVHLIQHILFQYIGNYFKKHLKFKKDVGSSVNDPWASV